jgi:long-chain acyl-CoA synthetase
MIRTELIASISDLIRRHAGARPNKVAFRDARTSITYGELSVSTANLAGHLQNLGIASGDCVAIMLPNSVQWVESCFAIVRAGGISVPISYEATVPEVSYRLSDANCKVIITTHERAQILAGIMPELVSLKTIIIVGQGANEIKGIDYAELTKTAASSAPRDSSAIDEASFIIYTSGTTGRAKGVLLSTRSMLWVTAACWAPIAGLSEHDSVLSPLPLYHSYALNFSVLSILAVGASEYILEKYSTREVTDLLQTGQFTIMPGVPTMFHYLLESTRANPNLRFPGLRVYLSAGAIMPAAINREFEERFGVPLLDGYGITETSTMVTLNWLTGSRMMGSCGLPLPGLATRIVSSADGHDVAPGEEGELIVRGPNLMSGYHNKPEETASAIRNGWYHTGDLARSDKNGFLTITGRLKEIIIRGGQNIAPSEIEEAVNSFDGVLDCAAIGIDHEKLGEVPVVFVVPRAGVTLTSDHIIEHCKTQLSSYKLPYAVHLIEEIPRTGSGKIMRFKLREYLKKDRAQ